MALIKYLKQVEDQIRQNNEFKEIGQDLTSKYEIINCTFVSSIYCSVLKRVFSSIQNFQNILFFFNC